MKNTRKRIEKLFEKLTGMMITFRFPVIGLILLVSVLLASQMRHLRIDTSNEGLLRPDDPIILNYNEFRDQFGRDDLMVLAIESDQIFTVPFLKKLQRLHRQIEDQVPHVSEITSLVNGRETRGQGDVLLVDDLLADFPETEEQLAELKERVLSNPVYTNMLISQDGTLTTVLVKIDTYSSVGGGDDALAGFDELVPEAQSEGPPPPYLTDKENAELVRVAGEIVQEFNGPDFKIHMAGSPVVTHAVRTMMMQDMKRFLRLAVVTIGLCLLVMFRRLSGVVLPLLVVALTLVTTLGLMAIFDIPFRTTTIILPSFLLAVGVGASVHVLSLVYQRLRRTSDVRQAVVYAYGHSGLAVVMTSLTTAAGLASFAAAKIAPVADLGVFSALGVLLSLAYTLLLLPPLLSLLPLSAKKKEKELGKTRFDTLLDWVTEVTHRRARLIVIVSLAGIMVALFGVARVQFSHNLLSWLPQDTPVRQATEVIDQRLRGSVALEVVLDTGRENGLYDRDVLMALDRLATDLEQFKQDDLFIGKITSVATILKEIHKALNENRPEMYRIPENSALIPQEFLLFENSGSDDLQDVVDSLFQQARITIKVPWRDSLAYVPFIQEIEARFKTAFDGVVADGQPVQIRTTGIMSLFARILYATITSAAQSYGIAFGVITLMMVMLLGNLRLGLVAMIPNLGPILIVMGIMGWVGIPLDMFTMLVASVAIGLAVDDTVHFMYNFKRYYEENGDVKQAVGRTLHTAGRAMVTTSIVLSIGFFIFLFASMINVMNFGLLTGLAIVLALLGDFFLAPALMVLLAEKMLTVSANE